MYYMYLTIIGLSLWIKFRYMELCKYKNVIYTKTVGDGEKWRTFLKSAWKTASRNAIIIIVYFFCWRRLFFTIIDFRLKCLPKIFDYHSFHRGNLLEEWFTNIDSIFKEFISWENLKVIEPNDIQFLFHSWKYFQKHYVNLVWNCIINLFFVTCFLTVTMLDQPLISQVVSFTWKIQKFNDKLALDYHCKSNIAFQTIIVTHEMSFPIWVAIDSIKLLLSSAAFPFFSILLCMQFLTFR